MTNRFIMRRVGIGSRILVLLLAVCWLTNCRHSRAEEAWEYSAYQVDVVVVAAPGSGLTDVTEAELRRGIKWYSGITDLAVWQVQPRAVPEPLRYELASSFQSPNIDLIKGLDLVVVVKKDKHSELKLKKLGYFLTAIEEAKKKEAEPPRIGICDPATTIVGRRCRQLLYRYWLENSQSHESDVLEAISDDASSPAELVDQVLADQLDLAIVRRQDVSTENEAIDIVPVDEVERKDKLFLVVADVQGGQYRVRAREFDCRGLLWGPVEEKRADQIELLPRLAYEAVELAFAPIVRIEDVSQDGDKTTTRLRAGGLIDPELSPNSPARLDVGSIMRPIIRRNDRLGNVLENGIEVLQWSYLEVVGQDGVRFECDIYSAFRNPVGGRSSSRVERTALLVRPTADWTELRLATKDDPPQPLPNYEIYEKGDDDKSILLGRTDWRGSIRIDKGEKPVRVVYVKNGQRVLARLPLVPGLFPVETAETYDDSHRLWAEGRIRALRSAFLDLVARRQVLDQRIRNALEEGEYPTAKKLADELSRLPDRDEFRLTLQDLAQDIQSDDPREQRRIDALLNDIRQILPDHLDPNLAPSLQRAVDSALRSQPAS